MSGRTTTMATLLGALVTLGAAATADESVGTVADQVRAHEMAFARTMADRDHAAFVTFVSEEALFIDSGVLRGREAVGEGWRPLFDGPDAPFSWAPERVEVIESGTLAISTGPVRNSDGERIGTYNSTWRLEEDGEWRVILDIGCPPCRSSADPPPAPEE